MNQLEETAIRLKMLVASSALPTAAGSLRLNISAGCSVAEDDDDQKSLIARTDAMMYKDKASRATPPRIL
jgi:PleD family two-component response regulator